MMAGGNRTFTTLEVCGVRKIARFVFQSTKTQCSLNERFLYSAFCQALSSVHAVTQVICSDALKIHPGNQMIWPYSRKLGMTV